MSVQLVSLRLRHHIFVSLWDNGSERFGFFSDSLLRFSLSVIFTLCKFLLFFGHGYSVKDIVKIGARTCFRYREGTVRGLRHSGTARDGHLFSLEENYFGFGYFSTILRMLAGYHLPVRGLMPSL